MPDAGVSATVLGRMIVQASRVLDVPFGAVLDRHGVTRNGWWLLSELYRSRAGALATLGEHARRSALAASSATVAADQLVGLGLTRRWRPAGNRRITMIAITDAGVAFVEAVRADLEVAVHRLYRLYDPAERETLHGLLSRLLTDPAAPAAGSDATP
ncbi:MarR family transcriptional regulator [Pilimelia anulata]|uniref:MarR family transcriptional regulator n=1 Tax=Pilimelia anulata TaxID=53371 RepID=A0A8J3BGJ7_9ACTN|nr:hypothetical protein [Pilimelia anulata]GGK02087.1 MarR family transcriptional regulator [Pilimelia anulata]